MIDYKRLAKAETHPVRLAILDVLDNSGKPISPNELHLRLKLPLSNVSYHVRGLQKAKIVKLVKTEQRRGAVEHYYRVAGR